MTVTVFGSAKGSPGVTTSVLALAARWPGHREALVIEADPAGGDVVARLAPFDPDVEGLRDSPSTVQLAAACRAGLTDQVLLEHLQRLPGPGELRILVGPASSFAASTAVTSLVSSGLAERLSAISGADVLVDIGRIDPTSPAMVLTQGSASVVLVVRPTVESVLHTRDLASSLRTAGTMVSLLVIGERPYGPDKIAAAVDAPVCGVVPDDAVGARALAGDAPKAKVLARSLLLSAASSIAARFAPAPVEPMPGSTSQPVEPATVVPESEWVSF